jgi:hypothetical protein
MVASTPGRPRGHVSTFVKDIPAIYAQQVVSRIPIRTLEELQAMVEFTIRQVTTLKSLIMSAPGYGHLLNDPNEDLSAATEALAAAFKGGTTIY